MNDPKILNFGLKFNLIENLIGDDINAFRSETDKTDSQFCNGKFVWDNVKANVQHFLMNCSLKV